MAARKTDLATQVETIVTDAIDRVRSLIANALSSQLSSLLSGTGSSPRKPGPKPGKKAAARTTGKGGSGKKGGGRRRRTDERMEKLVALVNKSGTVVPASARKKLKLSAPQMQLLARQAAAEGLIKVTGQGRGTRYLRA